MLLRTEVGIALFIIALGLVWHAALVVTAQPVHIFNDVVSDVPAGGEASGNLVVPSVLHGHADSPQNIRVGVSSFFTAPDVAR